MNTNEQTNATKKTIVRGISFQPDIWDRLEAAVSRYGRRSRSQIVEWALSDWFDMHNDETDSDQRHEGVA